MGQTIQQSNDWHALVDSMASVLVTDPPGPFEAEQVIVPTAGVARVLAQELARRIGGSEGICSGVSFVPQRQFFAQLLARSAPAGNLDDWRHTNLTLAVARCLPEVAAQPGCELLARHLDDGPTAPPGRRIHLARRVTQLLLDYIEHAPDLIRRWNAHEPVLDNGEAIPDVSRWQFLLWQSLCAHLGTDDPVKVADSLIAAPPNLGRLHLFTPTRLAPLHGELLAALTKSGELHTWLSGANSAEPQLAAGDQSSSQSDPRPVSVHSSHGPLRQVEVLRDLLCDRFAADPNLEPRQVLIVTAEPTTYWPLLRATFEGAGDAPGAQLRLQLSSTSAQFRNEALAILLWLLNLPTSRATADDLSHLCRQELVATRFGFTPNDLERLPTLLAQTNVRWGIDTNHRRRFQVDVQQNTWLTGIDQLLAGLAMPESELTWLGTVMPSDAIAGSEAPLVGGLAELISRVRRFIHLTAEPMRLQDWAELLSSELGNFVEATEETALQVAVATATLADLASTSANSADLHLTRADVAALLEPLTEQSWARPNHGNGSLHVAAPGELPGVPHKIVCLLGAQLPPRRLTGADWLARQGEPQEVERDLWAMAATSSLVESIIVYQGRDERTNLPVPEPVILTRLLDELGQQGCQVNRFNHPLISQDPQNFTTTGVGSFDAQAASGARALLGPKQRPATSAGMVAELAALPPAPPPTEVELTDLESWLASPNGHMLARTAGVRWPSVETPDFALPIEPDPLSNWGLANRLLDALLDGHSLETAAGAEWRKGSVGPRALGEHAMRRACQLADGIWRAGQQPLSGQKRLLNLEAEVGPTRIVGNLTAAGQWVVDLTVSRSEAKAWARAWLRSLLISAAGQGVDGVLVIGAGDKVSKLDQRNGVPQHLISVREIPTVPKPQAIQLLGRLLSLYVAHSKAPLPIAYDASLALARHIGRLRTPATIEIVRQRLRYSYQYESDQACKYFYPTLDDLLAEPARVAGACRFAELSADVFVPMISATRVSHV